MRWPESLLRSHPLTRFTPVWALTLLLPAGMALAQTSGAVEQFVGRAHSLKTGKVLYIEHHQVTGQCQNGHWTPSEDKITYRSANGKVIGRKSVDYRPSLFRPSFHMKDGRFGEDIQVVNHGDKRITETLHDRSGNIQHFQQAITPHVVVDAGFDYFIRAHWAPLAQGHSLSLALYAPTRGKTYQFAVDKADAKQRKKIDAPFVFVMKPEGLLVGFLVNPVILGYNQAHRITDYLGLTNIAKNKETNYQAHIHYHYTQIPCGSG